MDIVSAMVPGILFAILLFGIKTGAGCGFSSIDLKKVFILAGGYFVISVVMGALTGQIDIAGLHNFAGMGMTVHSVLALLLISAGVYTMKKWNCGCDVSKHTFMLLSLPCPVCLTGLFLSCMLLTTYLEVSGIWVGVLVGCVFFIAVVSSAYLFRKMGKTPDTLGNIMLFLGIFYLASVLLVPAYMQTQSMELASVSGDEVGIMPFFIFAIIILAGFFREYRRHA